MWKKLLKPWPKKSKNQKLFHFDFYFIFLLFSMLLINIACRIKEGKANFCLEGGKTSFFFITSYFHLFSAHRILLNEILLNQQQHTPILICSLLLHGGSFVHSFMLYFFLYYLVEGNLGLLFAYSNFHNKISLHCNFNNNNNKQEYVTMYIYIVYFCCYYYCMCKFPFQ